MNFYYSKQGFMLREGELYRRKYGISSPPCHKFGIYSTFPPEMIKANKNRKNIDKVTGILRKVDTMKLNDNKIEKKVELEADITQGDELNQIKARRQSQVQTPPL